MLIAVAVFGDTATAAQGAKAREGAERGETARLAYDRGRLAYHRRAWREAMGELEEASRQGVMLADFYRARIYGDNESPFYSRPKSYELYTKLSKVLGNIDPEVDPRVMFAGQTFTALARFLRDGIEQIGLEPDRQGAYSYLNLAWTFFRDKDAEFEIARMRLVGDGLEASPRLALHSLYRLARSGHAGALATLAEVYWRGKPLVKRNSATAYMFATLAVENAPYSERLWIEDSFQKIYCSTDADARGRGRASVAGWRKQFGGEARSRDVVEPVMGLMPRPVRTCSDGETLVLRSGSESDGSTGPAVPADSMPALLGDTTSIGLHRSK